MTNCKICQNRIDKTWDYCPKCGQKTKEETFEIKVDKIKYLVERQKGGDTVYKNFEKTIKLATTVNRPSQSDLIREKLGNFVNLNFGNLRLFSLLHQKPDYINEFFKVGKLLGYFISIEELKEMGKTEYIGLHYDSDVFWNFIGNDNKRWQELGWTWGKEGFLQFAEADKKKGIIRYHLRESPVSVLRFNRPLCFFELATECGVAEASSNAYWTGRETKCECKGDEYCEFEIILEREYSEPHINEFSKKELDDLLNQCVDNVVFKKVKRKKLGDTIVITDDQIINYMLVSPSPGHNILSKYSGSIVGGKITEKKNINDLDNVVDYFIELFEYMRVGLIQVESKTDDMIKLRMDESAYSSGVKNINRKLDAFIAGIIEGALKQATGQKWLVEETECLANGNDHCEFACNVR